jgi:hypothetical protein
VLRAFRPAALVLRTGTSKSSFRFTPGSAASAVSTHRTPAPLPTARRLQRVGRDVEAHRNRRLLAPKPIRANRLSASSRQRMFSRSLLSSLLREMVRFRHVSFTRHRVGGSAIGRRQPNQTVAARRGRLRGARAGVQPRLAEAPRARGGDERPHQQTRADDREQEPEGRREAGARARAGCRRAPARSRRSTTP